MAGDSQDKLEQIYSAALQLDPAQRSEFVRQACGEDEALRAEIESLLAHEEKLGSFLENPAVEAVTATAIDEPTAGHVLGRYRLLQRIGEGGMGEVWLAEQKEPVRRRVALKLVKAGMNTREVLARFESERQALALMDHPAIAKVFDAGSTSQGTPYFVMEYVAGVSITAYCDNHRLGTHERLELFMRVCEGVQHAHQKAIIHRDLKPSNILVAEVDGRPAPKIIDFGVAKALSQKLTADTLFTRVGALVGTPEYMSPEQANSSGEDIDTRTDVYSLGIILYELLAGVPPLELRRIAFDEFLRKLREEEPPKPSTKIRTQDQATSTEVARKRQTDPLALAKQIRGDLDSITLKAIEKERSRRYGSPSDFAADIGRYLRNEAVLAVPPSAAYRARKFGRRHRAALFTACAFTMVLILAAAVSIWQSIRANREAAVAQAINDFLQNDLLAQASTATQLGSKEKPDPDLKVRTALDRAAVRIAGRLERQPEIAAAIRETIGETYMDLGLYADAQKQLERALDLQRRRLGLKNPKTLRTMSQLGASVLAQGKVAEAEKPISEALEIQRRVLGPEHPDTLYSMTNLAHLNTWQQKPAQAEELYRQILEIQRRVLGPEHRRTMYTMSKLAEAYADQSKYARAEELQSQILDIQRRVLGPEHPDTLDSMDLLSRIYYQRYKYVLAEDLTSKSIEIRRRVLGPDHPDTLASMDSLAYVYYLHGKYAQAAELYTQALEIQRRVLGPENTGTLRSTYALADVFVAQGKYADAEALYNQALNIQRRILGPEQVGTLWTMNSLAEAYMAQGKYAQAEALFTQTLNIERRVLGPEIPNTLYTVADLASTYLREGKAVLAEKYAAQALAGFRRVEGSDSVDAMATAASLALAYLSQGKFAENERLARELVELNRKKPQDDWRGIRAECLLGASLAGQKKYAEAEPLLLEGYKVMLANKERIWAPDRYQLDLAREWIVKLYQAWGKPGKAAEWRKKKWDPLRPHITGALDVSQNQDLNKSVN